MSSSPPASSTSNPTTSPPLVADGSGDSSNPTQNSSSQSTPASPLDRSIKYKPKVRFLRQPKTKNDLWSNFEFNRVALNDDRNAGDDVLICYKINVQPSLPGLQSLGSWEGKTISATTDIWNTVEKLASELSPDENTQQEVRNYKHLGIIEICGGIEKTKLYFRSRLSSEYSSDAWKTLIDLNADKELHDFLEKDEPGIYLNGTHEKSNPSNRSLKEPERIFLLVRISFLGYDQKRTRFNTQSLVPEKHPTDPSVTLRSAPPRSVSSAIASTAPVTSIIGAPSTSSNILNTETKEFHDKRDPLLKDIKFPEVFKDYKVHEALFLVVNEEVIVTTKSKGLKEENLVTLPGQKRGGIFHLLVHMISDVVRAQDKQLDNELKKAAYTMEYNALYPDYKETADFLHHFPFIHTLRRLTEEQLNVLLDLEETFSQAVYSKDEDELVGNTYTSNILHTPMISGKDSFNEQMAYVKATLIPLINERRKIIERCDVAIQGMNKLSNDTGLPQSFKTQTEVLKGELAAQKSLTEQLTDEIGWQGKTLSVFTIVSVVFHPLGFFSQYFSGDYSNTTNAAVDENSTVTKTNSLYSSRNGAINSIGRFWLVTGLITFTIALIATCFVFKSRYEGRKVWRTFRDWFTLKGWSWPLTKPDAWSQLSYIRRLSRYQVFAIPVHPENTQKFHLQLPHHPKSPENRDTPLQNGKESLPLFFSNSPSRVHSFAFDPDNGLLFVPEVDRYDCTYHVCGPRNPPSVHGKPQAFDWTRSTMVVEKLPWVFRGRFSKQKDQAQWKWASGPANGKPKWDISGGDLSCKRYFRIPNTTPNSPGSMLFIHGIDEIPQTPTAAEKDVYILKFIKEETAVIQTSL